MSRQHVRMLALCAVLAIAGCRGCETAGVFGPVRRLADEEAQRAGLREPVALTLGDETRYVLAPATGAYAIDTPVVADDAGLVHVDVPCPPALRGETVLWTAETIVIRNDAPPIDRGNAGVVTCPTDGSGPSVTLDAGAPGQAVLVRKSVAAPPSPRATLALDAAPRGSSLRFAVGVRRIGSPPAGTMLPAEVRARDGQGATVTLWQGRVPVPAADEPEVWREVAVPLDPAAERLRGPLSLEFAGESSRHGDEAAYVAWADPTIWASHPRATGAAWNVLVISLDTLRADRLGAYGYPLDTSPVLDRLAHEGTLFEGAVSQSNWTLPSHVTLLTGTLPCVHDQGRGLRKEPRPGGRPTEALPFGITPLAEVLRREGYSTAAFTEDGYLTPGVFQRGFDLFRGDRRMEQTPTAGLVEATVGAARSWLDRHASERFFLFVHTYQVHAPYTPPEKFAARVPAALPLPRGGLPPAQTSAVDAAHYVGEVAYTDAALAPLLATLDALHLSERTIVVVVSDHGEAFGEHGAVQHGTSLYEEELHVPMIWRAPGLIASSRRVPGMVGLVDVTPTILDLLGIARPPWMQGTSLAPSLRTSPMQAPAPDRVLPMEGLTRRGVRAGTWKAVTASQGYTVFDLTRDPAERRGVPEPATDASVLAASRALDAECASGVAAVGAAPGANARAAGLPASDPARDQKLRALGYAE